MSKLHNPCANLKGRFQALNFLLAVVPGSAAILLSMYPVLETLRFVMALWGLDADLPNCFQDSSWQANTTVVLSCLVVFLCVVSCVFYLTLKLLELATHKSSSFWFNVIFKGKYPPSWYSDNA